MSSTETKSRVGWPSNLTKWITNAIVRSTVRVLALYIRRFPFKKGKGRLFDVARWLLASRQLTFGEVTVQTAQGACMRMDMTSVCQRQLFLRGVYSVEETQILNAILETGDVFIDIGAHVGYFSILASSIVGQSGLVMAFEPSPPMRQKLVTNIELNSCDNVQVFPHAVSNVSGQETFFLCRQSAGNSSLRPLEACETDEVKVTTVALDTFVDPDVWSRIKMIKLDIEGAELLALRGMRELLIGEQAPDILCEVTDEFLLLLGGSENALLKYMDDLGYLSFRLDSSGPVAFYSAGYGKQYNALFTKRRYEFLGQGQKH